MHYILLLLVVGQLLVRSIRQTNGLHLWPLDQDSRQIRWWICKQHVRKAHPFEDSTFGPGPLSKYRHTKQAVKWKGRSWFAFWGAMFKANPASEVELQRNLRQNLHNQRPEVPFKAFWHCCYHLVILGSVNSVEFQLQGSDGNGLAKDDFQHRLTSFDRDRAAAPLLWPFWIFFLDQRRHEKNQEFQKMVI